MLLATDLLMWYDQTGRVLPWRIKGSPHHDPYQVWLSEIMLQQTGVTTVIPYFKRFIEKWPTVHEFALASLEDILHAWQGLGYYARARHMYHCAQMIVHQKQGKFPSTSSELRTLPGIGSYTAAAIAAIAFDEKITPIDGNIIRVLSRIYAVQEPKPPSLKKITALAQNLTPSSRSGDFAQALMDLGATICIPRHPKCLICPLQMNCLALKQGIVNDLPRKAPKGAKKVRYAIAFLIKNDEGAYLLRKRNEKGLLGGMIEVPTTPWVEFVWNFKEAQTFSPLSCQWQKMIAKVKHTFTHFDFNITIYYGIFRGQSSPSDPLSFWVKPEDFPKMALPTVMKKILKQTDAIF